MSAESLRPALLISSGAVIVLVLGWVILMILTAPRGSVEEQLERLRRSSAAYRWNFVNASLIAPPMVTMLVLIRDVPPRGPGILDGAGTAFLIAYLALITPTYASQYTVLPAVLRKGSAAAWHLYFGDPESLSYFLGLLAYGLFGVGASLLAPPLVGAGGVWTWAGWTLLGSGVSSILGFAGYAAKSKALEFLNVVGGVLTIPFAALVFAGAFRL